MTDKVFIVSGLHLERDHVVGVFDTSLISREELAWKYPQQDFHIQEQTIDEEVWEND